VYVLTSHLRGSIVMKGGTVFHFVTDGIQAALDQAFAAAGEQDVRSGEGWPPFDSIAGAARRRCTSRLPRCCSAREASAGWSRSACAGYACTEQAASDKATHVVITKQV
jgi:hypothetical protein